MYRFQFSVKCHRNEEKGSISFAIKTTGCQQNDIRASRFCSQICYIRSNNTEKWRHRRLLGV
jgi:hypothetical protein